MTYILGRFRIARDRLGCVQSILVLIWMTLDMASIFYVPLKYLNVVYEASLTIAMLAYLTVLTVQLQRPGRQVWIMKLGAIVLWGLGWGLFAVLFWCSVVDQTVIMCWFMTYAALFPNQRPPSSPGISPTMHLTSPWLASIAKRRIEKEKAEKADTYP